MQLIEVPTLNFLRATSCWFVRTCWSLSTIVGLIFASFVWGVPECKEVFCCSTCREISRSALNLKNPQNWFVHSFEGHGEP